ncbi:uncharacterized protein [Ptychodera flava]|uniref:uncharacterized protein n=1 Tax=Ptychodera flava TaxID=63121 RepID=UPI003969D062
MILELFVALATFFPSDASFYYCPRLTGHIYKGQYVVIGQPNTHIYLSKDHSLLLNSSLLVQGINPPSLCVNRTDKETEMITILGCTGSSTDSRIDHEIIDILGYYMLHLSDYHYFSKQYTLWRKDTRELITEYFIELLPDDSTRWKVLIRQQRSTSVIHHLGSNAQTVTFHMAESQDDIAVAWLERGTAYYCHLSFSSFEDVLFLTANSSYLSLTFSGEFSFYGNYTIQVTYTNANVWNYSIEVVQDDENGSTTHTISPSAPSAYPPDENITQTVSPLAPSASPDEKINRVGAIVGGSVAAVVVLLLLMFVVFKIIKRRRCKNRQSLIPVDAQEPKQDAKLIESKRSTDERVVDSQEPKHDAKLIKSKRSTDERVGVMSSKRRVFLECIMISTTSSEIEVYSLAKSSDLRKRSPEIDG